MSQATRAAPNRFRPPWANATAKDKKEDKKTSIWASRFRCKPCEKFEESGICTYGTRCMFAHGKDQMRTKDMNFRDGLISREAIQRFQDRAEHLVKVANQPTPGAFSPIFVPTSAGSQNVQPGTMPGGFLPLPHQLHAQGSATTATSSPLPGMPQPQQVQAGAGHINQSPAIPGVLPPPPTYPAMPAPTTVGPQVMPPATSQTNYAAALALAGCTQAQMPQRATQLSGNAAPFHGTISPPAVLQHQAPPPPSFAATTGAAPPTPAISATQQLPPQLQLSGVASTIQPFGAATPSVVDAATARPDQLGAPGVAPTTAAPTTATPGQYIVVMVAADGTQTVFHQPIPAQAQPPQQQQAPAAAAAWPQQIQTKPQYQQGVADQALLPNQVVHANVNSTTVAAQSPPQQQQPAPPHSLGVVVSDPWGQVMAASTTPSDSTALLGRPENGAGASFDPTQWAALAETLNLGAGQVCDE